MGLGRSTAWAAAMGISFLPACSGGGGGGGNAVVGIVQDLALDPDGRTTVVTFTRDPGLVGAASFDCSGPQVVAAVMANGPQVEVAWNERVTPSHQVRVLGISGIGTGFHAVTTTDASAPSFVVQSAVQNPGLGGDTMAMAFSGPRVIEQEAEDLANWTLEVMGQSLDLSGSAFNFDAATQVLDVTLGSLANLHASFELRATGINSVADVAVSGASVAGAASGDSTAPALIQAEQNLAVDEYGRVVDFLFSEAMDPLFSPVLSNFGVSLPDVATNITQPADDVFRVSFNNPIIPGIDSVVLANLLDAHGNPLPVGPALVTQPSPVANAFDAATAAVTAQDELGDRIVVVTAQALESAAALDPVSWSLAVGGSPIAMAGQTLSYDFLAKTLTIDLDFDMQNGQPFTVTALGALEVDGQSFSDSFAGTVGGDSALPAVLAAQQNRTVDPRGRTVDVQCSEDVDDTTAELLSSWRVSGGVNLLAATRLASLDIVRLQFDDLVLPGDFTLSATGVEDLAGNAMVPQVAIRIQSTDATPPSALVATATAVEGADDDILAVVFNDQMVAADVEDPSLWTVESPPGSPVNAQNASIAYNQASKRATLVFDGGDDINLRRGQGFTVQITAARDVGGNTIAPGVLTGAVVGEAIRPELESVWVESLFGNRVHVRFSEPVDFVDDIGGLTRYVARNSGGVVKGGPTSAVRDPDKRGVVLTYGFAVLAGSDTLDVLGLTDLAGNYFFPALAVPVQIEDWAELALLASSSATTVSGEENDLIAWEFDRVPSRWGLFDPANYAVSAGGIPVDLTGAEFEYGGATTLVMRFSTSGAPSLTTGTTYDLAVDHLTSIQGVSMSAASTESVAASGDATSPALPAGSARVDAQDPAQSLLVEMDEAIDGAAAADPNAVTLNGSIHPASSVLVGPRTVRSTFPGGVSIGDTVAVDFEDLAGNVSSATSAVATQDVAGPLVVSVDGASTANAGGDYVVVAFDQPVELSTALDPLNYSVVNGGVPLSLTGAQLTYASSANTVAIYLPEGEELQPSQLLTVQVDDVENHAGLAMNPPANIGGPVSGDSSAPSAAQAFSNYRVDPAGVQIDVLFPEDVRASDAQDSLRWTASGGQAVLGVQSLDLRHYRIELTLPLSAGQVLWVSSVHDLAGNASVQIAITPVL